MSEQTVLPSTPDTEMIQPPEDQLELISASSTESALEPDLAEEQNKSRTERLKQLSYTVGRTALKAAKVTGAGSKFAAKQVGIATYHTARIAGVGAKFAAKKTGKVAKAGIDAGVTKVHELKASHEARKTERQQFYYDAGKVAIKLAYGEKVSKDELPKPNSRLQKVRLEGWGPIDGLRTKGEKIAKKVSEEQAHQKVYGEKGPVENFSIVRPARTAFNTMDRQKTWKARGAARELAEKRYNDGEISKDEMKLQKELAGSLVIYKGTHSDEKIAIRREIAVQELEKKIEKRAGVPAPQIEDLLPEEDESDATETLNTTDVPVAPTRRQSAVERLRQMRADGLLPPPPEETPASPEPLAREPEATAEVSTKAPLDTESVEKMAELAYLTAKDEVFRQIDEEDAKRVAEGKPKLTKEEKAEVWKNERVIRQQLLGTISPEQKSLVNKQIGELMKADKAARQAGGEQLRDKRRREAREKAAARQASRSSRTTPQRSGETVQQRARREREEKLQREREAAASVNENAQRTALDL